MDVRRTTYGVPLRLTVADRELALLPLDVNDPHGAALLVRASPLLDGLNAIFDMIWSRATLDVAGANASPHSLGSELDAMIPLLAAGLNDKAIAHRLRISVRTLLRRVAKLSTELGARSRFQAGWAAALRLGATSMPEVARAATPIEPPPHKALSLEKRVVAARHIPEVHQPPT